MGIYRDQIMEYAGVDAIDAGFIEEIMRDDIFHSTLDWVPTARFKKAAQKGKTLLAAYRADKELAGYFKREG